MMTVSLFAIPKTMTLIRILILFLCFSGAVAGQSSGTDSLKWYFSKQLAVYPQEKLYLHTDKSSYLSGEKIWFRAYPADAAGHRPMFLSRYVYVELVDPLGKVISRVKIRPQDNAWHGYIPVSDAFPEGRYTLRAYTHFMQNAGEDYFYRKPVYIGNLQTQKLQTDIRFTPNSDRKVSAEIRFGEAIRPERVHIRVNDGQFRILPLSNKGVCWAKIGFPVDSKKRVILLDTKIHGLMLRQYFPVPFPEDEFDVSFFPEGGRLIPGVLQKTAFKAVGSDGLSVPVSGIVYDDEGNEITELGDAYLGMGYVNFVPKQGRSYYAVCTNGNSAPKRFALPSVSDEAPVLSVQLLRGDMFVTVLHPGNTPSGDTLYLAAHAGGILQYVSICGQQSIHFPTDFLSSGVLHLFLLDSRMNILSERLVFIDNDDRAKVSCHYDTVAVQSRMPVTVNIGIKGKNDKPLQGSFSVSVTDNGKVSADTSENILSHLLLTSELKGHIENPSDYFRHGRNARIHELDVLMLTQGWRRYDISRIVRGDIMQPQYFPEQDTEISGTVISLVGKPVEKAVVNIFAVSGNYLNTAETDKDGRFYFRDCELPDSTVFWLQAYKGRKKAKIRPDLLMNKEVYPEITAEIPVLTASSEPETALYQSEESGERNFIDAEGVWNLSLSEVTIEAQRKYMFDEIPLSVDYTMSADEIKIVDESFLTDLFRLIPGADVSNGGMSIFRKPVVFYVDGIKLRMQEVDMFLPEEIKQIEVINSLIVTHFGIVEIKILSITTLKGFYNKPRRPTPDKKAFVPLGYQAPAEFYTPKYDSPEPEKTAERDLRATIYWQPDLQVDETGAASFVFYTSDSPEDYTVVIEGIASDGTIVHHQDKIIRKDRK